MNSEYDIVVVGARCAGASTAMLLARSGLRVALVDRARPGTDTMSTHALMRAGVLQLHRWGLLDQVVAAGTPAIRQTVFHYADEPVAIPVKAHGGVDALYAPRRTVLDPILVSAAEHAGADVFFNFSATDVIRSPTGRVVGVTGHDARRAEIQITAAMTVGADGVRSTIANAVGAAVERRAARASGFVYAYVDDLPADGYEWFYRTGLTAGLIPTNDNRTVAWVGAPSARFRSEIAPDVPGGYRRLMAEMSPSLASRVAAAGPVGRFHSSAGVPGFIRKPWGPGWALVGDAGYWKDPITAHGISDALRDAEVLAGAIESLLSGAASESAALVSYQRTRDRLSEQLFAETEYLASYRWDMASIGGHLRAVSAAMSDEVKYLQALDDPDAARAAG